MKTIITTLLLILFSPASAFTANIRRNTVLAQTLEIQSPRPCPLWSSMDEPEEATDSVSRQKKPGDQDLDRIGVARKAVLLVPLFCKFLLVLAIKFATDLVVLPLLWTYRLFRLAKRKTLGMFGVEVVKPNGTTKAEDGDASNSTSVPK